MIASLQRALQMLLNLFTDMAPLVFVLAGLVLLALALWASHATWHSYRVLDAVAHAPLADLRSMPAGRVKLRGTAQALPAKPGQVPSGIAWYKRTRWVEGSSSTLVTTDAILLQDEHGTCWVDTDKAEIRPTTHESSHAFLDKSRSTTEQVIRIGDPLFAIGELRRRALSGAGHASCELLRSGGVLLVSGSPEHSVKLHYRLWLVVQAPLALLCLAMLALATTVHIGSYPPVRGSAVGTFITSLRNTPLLSGAGIEHPQWNEVDRSTGGGFHSLIESLLSTQGQEPTAAEADRRLLAVGPSFGLQLVGPPLADPAAQGWTAINVGAISMSVPAGWIVVEHDEGVTPTVGLVGPGSDIHVELRVLHTAPQGPGIALDMAVSNYRSAHERGANGIVLGCTPLSVDGAFGHVEVMNDGGVERGADGSLAHRTNSYRGIKRVGDAVLTAEFRATFAQADQDRFGATVLNIIRTIQFRNVAASR